MATSALNTYGTTFKWNDKDVAEITEISPPETSVKVTEVTNNDSGGFAENIVGILAGGEFSIKGNFIPGDTDGQIALRADHVAKTSRTAIITLPTAFGTLFSMTAFCTKFKLVTPFDGAGGFEASFIITGGTTFTVSTSAGLTTPFFSVSESGVIVPAAANDTYVYVVTVITTVESITITPTAAVGVITVDGNTVASGVASSAITLGAAGSVTDATIVVTETSKAPVTYTVHITRASAP